MSITNEIFFSRLGIHWQKYVFTHRYSRFTNENVISETYHVPAYGFLSNMHKEKDPSEKVPI